MISPSRPSSPNQLLRMLSILNSSPRVARCGSQILCVEEDMAPVDIYNRVHAALLQDGVALECQPLVDFLHAQLVGAHHTNAAIYLESELTQPRSVTSLIRHRNLILRSLSSSFPSVPTSQPSVQGMTIQDLKAFMEVVRDGQSNESKSQRQPSIPVSSVDKNGR